MSLIDRHLFPRIMRAKTVKEAWDNWMRSSTAVISVYLSSSNFKKEFWKSKNEIFWSHKRLLIKNRWSINQLRSNGDDVSKKKIVEKILITFT